MIPKRIDEDYNFQGRYRVKEAADIEISSLNSLWLGAVNKSVLSHFNKLADVVYTLAENADMYKGDIDCSLSPNYPAGEVGDWYRCSVAGLIGGGSGVIVEVGDRIQCIVDNAGGTQAAVGTSWTLFNKNIEPLTLVEFQAGADVTKYLNAAIFNSAGFDLTVAGAITLNATIGISRNLTITPSTNISPLIITGTNVTTASIFDVNATALTTGAVMDLGQINTKVSGYVYRGIMQTATLTGDLYADNFEVSCNTGTALCAHFMHQRKWSGNLPNASNNSTLMIYNAEFTGTVGSGGAEGGSVKGINVNFTLGTANGSAVDIYGAYISTAGFTRTSANSIYGLYVLVDATDDAAIYTSDGTTRVTLSDGTNAITAVGGSILPTISSTPLTDVSAYTIVGTNIATAHLITLTPSALTTGSLIDIAAITTKTSGYLYNGSMTTSTLDASTLLDDFSVSCAHDGVGADTLRMIRRTWSGAMPNGTANSDFAIFDGNLSSTVGSGGAEGGTLKGLNIDFTGVTLNGSAINAYGVYVNSTGITNTSSNSLVALNVLGAWSHGLDMNGCTNTTDIRLSNGATIHNTDANTLTITEASVNFSGNIRTANGYYNVKTIEYTLGIAGEAGVDYNFASAANNTEQPIELGTDILPAFSRALDVVAVCTKAVAGSGSTEIVFDCGSSSGGAEYGITAISLNTLNETTSADTIGKVAVVNTDGKVYFAGTPTANWDTLTAGTWKVYITYVDNSVL